MTENCRKQSSKRGKGRREIEKNEYLQKIINLCHGLLFDVILAFDVEGKKEYDIYIPP